MKYLVAVLLLVSQLAFADCNIRSASQLSNRRDVGNVTDLVKTVSYGKCDVKFKLTVDGETHDISGSYKGLENDSMLCYRAVEYAKKEFLLSQGGNFQTESITVCQEGGQLNRKIRIGDTILENEVGKSKITKYFTYRNSRCRMFTERNAVQNELRVYNGVICQVDNSNTDWIVVDKW